MKKIVYINNKKNTTDRYKNYFKIKYHKSTIRSKTTSKMTPEKFIKNIYFRRNLENIHILGGIQVKNLSFQIIRLFFI